MSEELNEKKDDNIQKTLIDNTEEPSLIPENKQDETGMKDDVVQP